MGVAFGAHGLKARLRPDRLETFETGVRYHIIHALALLATGILAALFPTSPFPAVAGWLFIAGTLLFSGSLYLIVFTDKRWFGAITPLGGLAFIAGWVCLGLTAL
ncbi:MAG: DUF423 domain-containing protein [Anaerolineales bacterium]|nr:DUF423 domain-containing protein [Anaerolineales bacterium]